VSLIVFRLTAQPIVKDTEEKNFLFNLMYSRLYNMDL
jgi:hypothetical protein